MRRRDFIKLVGSAAVSWPRLAQAQTYPSKPIKVIVPYAPGSGVDIVARAVAQPMSARLGQPLVIDNKPGAGTTLGTKAAASADPDGYTLFIGSLPTLVISAAAYTNAGYDPTKSFAPVASIASSALFLVIYPGVPANTLRDFITYAKQNPGQLKFGFALATQPHITGEHFKLETGTDIASIPYKASSQSLPDLVTGRIQMNVGPSSSLLPFMKEGKVRALAYTGTSRHRDFPDVPTMIESGFPQLTTLTLLGVLAPTGTSPLVVEKLHGVIDQTLNSTELQEAFAKLGQDPHVTSLKEFAALLTAEVRRWPPIVESAGLKAQ